MKKAGFLTVAMLVALAVAAAPSSGLSPTVDLKAAKHKHGSYEDGLQSLRVRVGSSKTVYWKVKNVAIDEMAHDVTLTDSDTGTQDLSGYRLTWFKGNENISSDVKGDGYEFNLPFDKSRRFSTVVKHKSAGTDGFCLLAQTAPFDQAAFGIPTTDACSG